MAQVNTLSQSQLAKNTGLVAVAFDPKRIAGAILVPKGYSLTAAQVATLQAKMTADAAIEALKNSRRFIFPFDNRMVGLSVSSAALNVCCCLKTNKLCGVGIPPKSARGQALWFKHSLTAPMMLRAMHLPSLPTRP